MLWIKMSPQSADCGIHSPRRPACPWPPFGRLRSRRPASPSCPRRVSSPSFAFPRAPARIAASIGGGAAPGAACFPVVRRSPAARRFLLVCIVASRTSAARSLQSLAMLCPPGGCLFPGLGLHQPLPENVGSISHKPALVSPVSRCCAPKGAAGGRCSVLASARPVRLRGRASGLPLFAC